MEDMVPACGREAVVLNRNAEDPDQDERSTLPLVFLGTPVGRVSPAVATERPGAADTEQLSAAVVIPDCSQDPLEICAGLTAVAERVFIDDTEQLSGGDVVPDYSQEPQENGVGDTTGSERLITYESEQLSTANVRSSYSDNPVGNAFGRTAVPECRFTDDRERCPGAYVVPDSLEDAVEGVLGLTAVITSTSADDGDDELPHADAVPDLNNATAVTGEASPVVAERCNGESTEFASQAESSGEEGRIDADAANPVLLDLNDDVETPRFDVSELGCVSADDNGQLGDDVEMQPAHGSLCLPPSGNASIMPSGYDTSVGGTAATVQVSTTGQNEAVLYSQLSNPSLDTSLASTSALLPLVMAQPLVMPYLHTTPYPPAPLPPFPPFPNSAHRAAPSAHATPVFGGIGEVEASAKKKRKRRTKLVAVDLDPASHQKLVRLVEEHHGGSLEQFLRFSVAGMPKGSKQPGSRRGAEAGGARKPALNKWKRIKFEQLRAGDAQELALAYRSLAAEGPPSKVEGSADLRQTPWEELLMPQLERMLNETKAMLACTEKSHDCPHLDCGRRFATPGHLRDHLNEHSGQRPYACSVEGCGGAFATRQLLGRHLKKHQRAYACHVEGCGKRFAFRERLVVHQKIHRDERPLPCPWEGCGKSFKWSNSLQGHLRTHTGEKPFQCAFDGCGRLFGYKVDLTRHVRTHYGQPARIST